MIQHTFNAQSVHQFRNMQMGEAQRALKTLLASPTAYKTAIDKYVLLMPISVSMSRTTEVLGQICDRNGDQGDVWPWGI
jgi:hypothetical protein